MEKSVFEVVKAPLGWSVFADNVKIGGVYDSRGAALEAAALAASYTVSDGGGVADHRAGRGGRKAKMGNRVWRGDGHSAIEGRALGHCRKWRPVRAIPRGKTW